ncbi:hypothetical protein CK203_008614 [Vitis vinifera]|uniref:Reverse transcriptase/retrotransposon-derived protein RNase H-like domain-containing protein n=1 Tax=Vitis vinifera TaxID=29760 RepID=A0A438KD50_VITVI|nr:hypothetical protein CK203_008614 [Vitis vinifera]
MDDFKVELPKKQTHPVDHPRKQWWTLHVDEASKVSGSGIGLLLQSSTEELIEQVIHINFLSSNNEAKYEVVLAKLDLALMLVAYWTTSKEPKGVTPFTLAYGMEVIIPTEIGISTAKTAMKDQMDNDEELIKQLDWVMKSEELQLSG